MEHNFTFDFAISYAGEEVGLANDLYLLLREKGAKVFFAKNEEADLFGKDLILELRNNFGSHTKFVIPIISELYPQKPWTKYEFRIAKKEEKKRSYEFILPIRLDNFKMKGLKEEKGHIDLRKTGLFRTAEIIIKKLRSIYPIEEGIVPNVWIATFGINIEELLENYTLPSYVPREYPYLCDWLKDNLMKRLSISPLEATTLLEDSRDGETLSVRVGFKWDPDETPLDFGDIGWWEVLEIAEFERIYPGQDWKEERIK